MSRNQERCVITILAMTGWMLFVGFPGQALAQQPTGQMPENAEARSYGDGWRCSSGYRESNGACERISVPEHGYLSESSRGSGWRCDRGYRADGNECIPITVPENAHLDFSGNGWECDKPYNKRSDRCVPSIAK